MLDCRYGNEEDIIRSHVRHILRTLREDDGNLQVVCKDGTVWISSLVLGTICPWLIQEISDSSFILCPDSYVSNMRTFFDALYYSEPDFSPSEEDIQNIVYAAEQLGVKLPDFLPLPPYFNMKNDIDADFKAPVIDGEDTKENNHLPSRKSEGPSFKCKYCSKEYNHIKAKNKHMISEHFELCSRDGNVYSCQDCGTDFVTELGRDKHRLKIHQSGRLKTRGILEKSKIVSTSLTCKCPFNLGNCSPTFDSVKGLKTHVKRSHPDKDKSCLICGLDVRGTREDLRAHVGSHPVQETCRFYYPCDRCGEVFLTENALVLHKRDAHSRLETLLCKYCNKEFKNPAYHRAHEAKHESSHFSDSFRCREIRPNGEVCNKVFKLKTNLQRHVRSHNKIKTHSCDDCGKSFVDSTRLKEHRWIHTNHRPYSCSYCDKSFRQSNHLKQHEASTHGKERRFECSICSKKFLFAYVLKTHMKAHDAEKRRQNRLLKSDSPQAEEDDEDIRTIYQCWLCQNYYESIESLEEHCAEHAEQGVTIDLQVDDEDFSSILVDEESKRNLLLRVGDDLIPPSSDNNAIFSNSLDEYAPEVNQQRQCIVIYEDANVI